VRGSALRALADLPGADRVKVIGTMLADPDPVVRMLGLVSAEDNADHGLAADQAVKDDPDDLVNTLATARLEKLAAPTTQSATQPGTPAAVEPAIPLAAPAPAPAATTDPSR
jgi:hypothetical protein